jgi:hypothetical protein
VFSRCILTPGIDGCSIAIRKIPSGSDARIRISNIGYRVAHRWVTSSTSVLFTSQVPGFSFVFEQFWGRAARASNDSQESGRLLIFAGSCDGKSEEDLAARVNHRLPDSAGPITADIFPSTQLLPECFLGSLARLPACWRPASSRVSTSAHKV